MAAKLRERYRQEITPALMRDLGVTNVLAVPRLEKIVLNMGLGEATQNPKLLDSAVEELASISGQKPVVTRAKKAIANFKLREGMPIGAMVTLRGDRMYEFFERLVNVALPRVRDFKGVPDRAFDGRTQTAAFGCVGQTRYQEQEDGQQDSTHGEEYIPVISNLQPENILSTRSR